MSKKVEPSDEQNEESHSRLMLAVKEYFKANQDWHVKKTRRAGENSRYWLSQIRMIARERREHIQQ